MIQIRPDNNGQTTARITAGERYSEVADERKLPDIQNQRQNQSESTRHNETAASELTFSDETIRAELLLFLSIGAEFIEQARLERAEAGHAGDGEEEQSTTGLPDALEDYALFAQSMEYLCDEAGNLCMTVAR